MPRRIGRRMEHGQRRVISDPIFPIDDPQRQIGLFHRIEERSRVTPCVVKREATMNRGTAKELCHLAGPKRRASTRPGYVSARRSAGFVVQPHRHDAEPVISLKRSDDRRQPDVRSDLGVVVEEHDKITRRRKHPPVAATGNPQVLVEGDDHVALDRRIRWHTVPNDHDFVSAPPEPTRRASSACDRRCQLARSNTLGQNHRADARDRHEGQS